MGDAPFACGSKAVQACAQPVEPASAAAVTLMADGRPLIARPGGQVAKATSETCVTGCKCNSDGQCLTTYCWHLACPNPRYDCELHFTHTPCQLGYTQFCESETAMANDLEQLRDLERQGFLFEKPEVALKKQMRSASEIEKEQAARDKAFQKQ